MDAERLVSDDDSLQSPSDPASQLTMKWEKIHVNDQNSESNNANHILKTKNESKSKNVQVTRKKIRQRQTAIFLQIKYGDARFIT